MRIRRSTSRVFEFGRVVLRGLEGHMAGGKNNVLQNQKNAGTQFVLFNLQQAPSHNCCCHPPFFHQFSQSTITNGESPLTVHIVTNIWTNNKQSLNLVSKTKIEINYVEDYSEFHGWVAQLNRHSIKVSIPNLAPQTAIIRLFKEL